MQYKTLKSFVLSFIAITAIGYIYYQIQNKHKVKLTQKQVEYINKCNKGESFIDCEKISKINRKNIKNESYLKSRKIEALISLEKCTISLDKIHCQELANELLQDNAEKSKISWLGRNITKKEYFLIFNLAGKESKNESNIRLNEEKDYNENIKNQKEDEVLDILRLCKNVIIENLNNPESLEIVNSIENQIRTGSIRYSVINNINRRAERVYKCFDP
tara:strand:+ start:275 stop:928 length:654 start_codon:yes stop_codon:yes gene_type:complete